MESEEIVEANWKKDGPIIGLIAGVFAGTIAGAFHKDDLKTDVQFCVNNVHTTGAQRIADVMKKVAEGSDYTVSVIMKHPENKSGCTLEIR